VTEKRGTTRLVRPLRGGQITIPAEFRKTLGIGDDTVLQLTLRDGELHMKPLRVVEKAKGSPWLRELYDEFAPARQEAFEREYSDEEINAAIDEAVDAVRSSQ